MQSSAEEPQVRPEKRSLKKGAGLLISISILSMLCFWQSSYGLTGKNPGFRQNRFLLK